MLNIPPLISMPVKLHKDVKEVEWYSISNDNWFVYAVSVVLKVGFQIQIYLLLLSKAGGIKKICPCAKFSQSKRSLDRALTLM